MLQFFWPKYVFFVPQRTCQPRQSDASERDGGDSGELELCPKDQRDLSAAGVILGLKH